MNSDTNPDLGPVPANGKLYVDNYNIPIALTTWIAPTWSVMHNYGRHKTCLVQSWIAATSKNRIDIILDNPYDTDSVYWSVKTLIITYNANG